MPADVVTLEDCASNYGVFEVPSSRGGTYTVTFSGSEGPAHCTCKAFEFSKDGECKHVRQVWHDACMYNPQWCDGNPEPTLRPKEYTYDRFSDRKCKCGGPMVYVRRAV